MFDSNRFSRREALAVAGAAGTMALAGCGGPGEEDDVDEDENGNGNDDEADVAAEDWEDVEAFEFEGRVEAWTGIEPEQIDGEENPTITLIEGQEYDFTWINADGILHNLEIRDENDEIVDDYQSDDAQDEGDEVTLDGVVATEEMTRYICAYHESSQVGDIEVESA
ncbi:PKD domain-containing protein [Natronorubrum sp. JWXQ-INN-674]|uniref:PKD domain-containing protein n=1 Tax=Natronorubrum halalkaliphilum TaxID=2691917 RepID=A0A6B0VSG5_9EURY|nr:PKD domain-containing protein [Natronorubrum halalkaliphilum]MXV64073.1 PKD domain-containing protein [Natronorubrum halalkaliphilum]